MKAGEKRAKAVIEYETPGKALLDDVRGTLASIAWALEHDPGREHLVAERAAIEDALRQLEALAAEDLESAGLAWNQVEDACGLGAGSRPQVAIDLVTAEGRAGVRARAQQCRENAPRKPSVARELEVYVYELGANASQPGIDEASVVRGSALEAYSRGRAPLWEAMAYLQTTKYGDVVMELGRLRLPLPRVRDIDPDDPRRLQVGRPVRTNLKDRMR